MKIYLQTVSNRFTKQCVLFLILIFGLITNTYSQDNRGTEFWICFPGNGLQEHTELYITAEQASTVTIEIPGIAFNQVVNVAAGGLQVVVLPNTAQVLSQFVAENKGIHITATTDVTVYGMNAATATTDAFLAFPLDALGREHYIMGYTRDFIAELNAQATVVATENNTSITITATVTAGGFTAGVPRTITLQRGQVYQLRSVIAASDYTGTKVVSDKPIAVFGGNEATNISGPLRAADYLVEQLPPTSTWGQSFLTVPLATRLAGDVFRFLAQRNGTQVRVNNVLVANLNAGQFFETILASTTYNRITSTEPILVGQYSRSSDADNVTSDPFFSLVPPDEQFLNNYVISAGTTNIPINFLNITSPTSNIATVRVDGVVVNPALWNAIPGSVFSGAKIPISNGVHRISSNLNIGVLVYGFGSYDSYGYLGGQSFSPVATVASMVLTPETGTGVVGTSQCFDALVKDQFNNPVVGVTVNFNITGANPGSTGFANTNASGIAHFCYTGTNAGTDNITASLGTLNDASSFIWTSIPVTDVYYSKASGDLHNVLTWGLNPDGSGPNPPDFGAGKTFILANRAVNYTMTGNWTIGGKLNIPAGSQLQISGFTLSIADFLGAGLLSGTTNSNLVVTQPSSGGTSLNFLPAANDLNNLTINSATTTTLASALDIYGVLTAQSGTFNTANVLTLKSTATNTARVAPVTGSISGTVTVERYIPARRAWRIMSAPVGGSQTINSAWQEGVTTSSPNPNPNPGYGTHITEGNAASGLDHNPLIAMPSIKTYISSIDNWVPLLNTNSLQVNSDAYMLFVRGDRGVPLGLNTVPATSTTLRATGPLKTGDQAFPVSASGFTAIPNPFASPINFATLTKNNVQNNFYLWDPKMGGTDGVGAYVLLSYNGSTYDVIPASVSPESQYIQSGQGFLVHSTGSAGSLIIKESDKSATPATDVFRVVTTPAANGTRGLRVSLQSVNNDNTTSLLDEVLSSYGSTFSDKVDNLDAEKVANVEENLGLVREGHTLMAERSAALEESDVLQLKLWNTSTQKRYLLEFNPENLTTGVSTAYLVDNYLKTTTPVNLNKVSQIYFAINADAGSASPNRFTVIFKESASLPIVQKNGIISYPNPVSGKTIQLMFNEQPQGKYNAELVNGLGQVVYKAQINHGGGTAIQRLQLSNKPAAGVYVLNITNSTLKNTIKVLVK